MVLWSDLSPLLVWYPELPTLSTLAALAWPEDQGIVHQGYQLSAGTSINHTMLQQSLPPLVTGPSPIPVLSPLLLLAGPDRLVAAHGEHCQPW